MGVNAPFQCRVSAANARGLRMQAVGLLTVSECEAEVFPVFHRSIHSGDLVVRNNDNDVVVRELFVADRALSMLLDDLAVQQLPHLSECTGVRHSCSRLAAQNSSARGCAAQQPIPVNHAVFVLGDINWLECLPVPCCVTH